TCGRDWASYNRLAVAEQFNNPPAAGLDWAALEQEVRVALTLAPRMEYGHTLLRVIGERSQAANRKSEIRNPKSETDAKSQVKNPKPSGTDAADSGIRMSDLVGMESANFRVT